MRNVSRTDIFVPFAITFAMIIYVGACLTPSSYSVALHVLGINAQPLFGTARPIRSDEYNALTPLFQIAVLGRHATWDVISPYHETLRGFWALPIMDWSLFFKPQLWAFWILPPAYAYSFYFAFLYASFLIGYTLLFRMLGTDRHLSWLTALAFLFGHFVQVWWTTNAPTFAFAPWPAIVFLAPLRPSIKLPVLFYSAASWIFGLVYPAFIIPAAFALTISVVAFRPDALKARNIAIAALAVAAVGLTLYLYYGDIIAVMQATIYPGQRNAPGGGVGWGKFVATVFPDFLTTRFSPLIPSNECEIAVASTFIPLLIISFADYRSILYFLRARAWANLIVILGLLMMAAWMTLPIPASVGRFLLWNLSPGNRMMWGFGLLMICYASVFASRIEFRCSGARFASFVIVVVGFWLVSKIGFTEIWVSKPSITAWQALRQSWFDWAILIPVGISCASMPLLKNRKVLAPLLLGSAALTSLVTFGTFNPLQSAKPIFNVPSSPFLDNVKKEAKENPNGWAVVNGGYSATLNGVGISAIDHVLPIPQLAFFRKVFPNLSDREFNQIFNRYAHIIPTKGLTKPYAPSADIIRVPMAPFERPLSISSMEPKADQTSSRPSAAPRDL